METGEEGSRAYGMRRGSRGEQVATEGGDTSLGGRGCGVTFVEKLTLNNDENSKILYRDCVILRLKL